ncbi:hypothetical protein VTI74DRAFT_10527 [Chaetomium olivicolor]
MADPADQERPSFTAFWKKSKEALGAKKIRFVEDKHCIGSGSEAVACHAAPTGVPQDKAKHRRAQVRKAQVQHRQRKANYVKQLEADVAEIREMIEAAERETQALLSENKAMRAKLQQAISKNSTPLTLDQGVSLLKGIPEPPQISREVEARAQEEELTMSFGFDEAMGAPTYYVSSMPSSINSSEPLSPENPDDLPNLTPSQTQAAINFILALEHLCRDHFHPSHYHPPYAGPPPPLIGPHSHGHTLMATSLALRNAPDHIFQAATRTRLFPGSTVSVRPSCLPSTSTTTAPLITTTTPLISSTNPATTAAVDFDHPDFPNTPENVTRLSWKTSSLTLRSLHGLARSLNPDDALELTPVQAWFELARRFGVERLMAAGVLDTLKRELVGVVKCPHFGASMERAAFESVVGRVLGGGGDGGLR